MKKAQIQGQVFTYIMAAIIIALIVGLGYFGFQQITELGGNVRLSKFDKDVSGDLITTALKTGSINTATYTLPPEVSKVCFYGTFDTSRVDAANDALVSDAITSDPETDAIFLIGDGVFRKIEIKTVMDIDSIASAKCFEDADIAPLQLQLKGHGRYVEVRIQ